MIYIPFYCGYFVAVLFIFGGQIIGNVSAFRYNLFSSNKAIQFSGSTGDSITGRMGFAECTHFCLDADTCKKNGCYYDWKKEHCFQSAAIAAATYDIDYGYNIQIGNAQCLNAGGRQHWDSDGFPFHADIGQGSNGLIYTTNDVIADVREQSQYIFQTQRRNRVIRFQIGVAHNNAPISNYQLRFLFAEYVERRAFDIRLNRVHVLKKGVDILKAVGKNRAYEIEIPFLIQSGRLRLKDQSSPILGNTIPVVFSHPMQSLRIRMAVVNGLCGIRMHPCTDFCHDAAACNEQDDCFYDMTIEHCVPEINMRMMCTNFEGKRDDCMAAGCDFCCESMSCLPKGEADADCNFGCREFCTDERRCKDHGCKYDPTTGICEEKEKTCEHLINVAHDTLENCLACTGSQCAYVLDTHPHLCVAEQRVDNKTWGEDYYTNPQQCESDCNLHLTGDTLSICYGCVRGGHCTLKVELCTENPNVPVCLSNDQISIPDLKPGETLIGNSSECKRICHELSNDAVKCRNSGCNFCCSSGECYAGHEQDRLCPTGCGSLCHLEDQCRDSGCYFDPNTEQCLENRAACSHFNGSMEMCLELDCEYCCKAMICFPTSETGVDLTPDPPPQIETKPGCCENGTERIQTNCFLELDGHHIAGRNACMAQDNTAYTGNFFKGDCPHNHYKYECSKTIPFWSNCVFGGRDLRFIGNETCKSVGTVFKNAVSGNTCPPGGYRFLCGNPRRRSNPTPGTSRILGRAFSVVAPQSLRAPLDFLVEHERRRPHPNKNVARWKRSTKAKHTGLTGRLEDLLMPFNFHHECSMFCSDATLCNLNNCTYDHLNMHCTHENTTGVMLDYGEDSPQSNSHCQNIGGNPHTDIWGYNYETDLYELGWQNSNAFTYPASTPISGIDQRDAYLHRTERQKRRISYYVNVVGGDGKYHVRIHLTELVYFEVERRIVTISLNKVHIVKANVDMFAEYGHGHAIILGYGVEVANGRLRVGRETSAIRGNRFAIEVFPAIISLRARSQMSAFCATKLPPCTPFCGLPAMCDNAGEECFRERRTNHCLPKTHFSAVCESLSGNRQMCDEQGCFFCCNTNLCHSETPTDTQCNAGCEEHCFYKDRCLAKNCKYIDETNICEDITDNCASHIAELTDSREQCNACTLGMCRYLVKQDRTMCVDTTLPLTDFQNVVIHHNNMADCDADPGLSNNKTLECRERGFKYCCETRTCYHLNDTDWECPKGCHRWCFDEQNCYSHGCYFNPLTNECQNYPAVHPCDQCDRCERMSCEEAMCWWDTNHDMCFTEIAMLNQTDCERNSGKYCPCGIPRCVPTGEDCDFPMTEEECLQEMCYFDCKTNTCIEQAPIQVAFVIDIASQENIDKIQEYAQGLTEMLRLRYNNSIEFAITTHADYDRYSTGAETEHTDVEFGCYKFRLELSNTVQPVELVAFDISPLENGGSNNGLSALTWTAADKRIGWSTNPIVKRVLWLMTHTSNNGDFVHPSIGNRETAKLDGTDTCSRSYATRYAAAGEFFKRNRFGLFGNFVRDPDSELHEHWGNLTNMHLGLPYGFVYTDSTDDEVAEEFDAFIQTL